MNLIALCDTWLMSQCEHGSYVDRMVCRPSLRNEFLAAAIAIDECDDEEAFAEGDSLPELLNVPTGVSV